MVEFCILHNKDIMILFKNYIKYLYVLKEKMQNILENRLCTILGTTTYMYSGSEKIK